MSVRALADEIGVSPSLVSQIERGKANPSVATLYSIVSVLGISLDDLFFDSVHAGEIADSPLAPASAVRSHGPVLRARDRPSVSLASGVRWERLSPSADAELDFLCVTYDVGAASCPPDALMQHNGREYGLVLQGRVGATVGFESYELEPGDSIGFESSTPHRFWTIGDEPSVVVDRGDVARVEPAAADRLSAGIRAGQ